MDAKIRQFIARVKKEHDDDVVDRAIYATTVYILGFFAILIMAKQYVGDPLQCWLPAEYPGAWEKYIENYCFVENTYFVAQNQSSKMLSPEYKDTRRQYNLRYYQWIPYILSVQALLCFAPKMLFKLLYSFSDLRVNDLIQVISSLTSYSSLISLQIPKLAHQQKKMRWEDEAFPKRIAASLIVRKQAKVLISFDWFLCAIFLLMKLLFLSVLLLQLVLINFFMGTFDPFWGFSIVWQLVVEGADWRNNGFFPRVTFCDLQTRDIGQVRQHTVQCVLMINMFAEKIFIFLWLWFFGFSIVASLNLLFWLWRTLSMHSKERMIIDALRLNNIHPTRQSTIAFINNYLKFDGIVVLRLIDSNAGYIQMADIVQQLWLNFNEASDIPPKHKQMSS